MVCRTNTHQGAPRDGPGNLVVTALLRRTGCGVVALCDSEVAGRLPFSKSGHVIPGPVSWDTPGDTVGLFQPEGGASTISRAACALSLAIRRHKETPKASCGRHNSPKASHGASC